VGRRPQERVNNGPCGKDEWIPYVFEDHRYGLVSRALPGLAARLDLVSRSRRNDEPQCDPGRRGPAGPHRSAGCRYRRRVQLRRDPDEQLAEHPSAFLTRDQRTGRASDSGSRAPLLHEPAAGRPAHARPASLDFGNGSLTWRMDRCVLCGQLRALCSSPKADHRRVAAARRVARRQIRPTGHFALYGRADGPEGPTFLANGQNGLFWTPQL
jgi:hypothetical protein